MKATTNPSRNIYFRVRQNATPSGVAPGGFGLTNRHPL